MSAWTRTWEDRSGEAGFPFIPTRFLFRSLSFSWLVSSPRGVTVAVFQDSLSCQAVGLKSGQAGGAQSWCSQGKQDITGLFSAEIRKFSPPSCCLPEVASIESAGCGWDCRRALWSGKLRACNFPSTQVTSLPG